MRVFCRHLAVVDNETLHNVCTCYVVCRLRAKQIHPVLKYDIAKILWYQGETGSDIECLHGQVCCVSFDVYTGVIFCAGLLTMIVRLHLWWRRRYSTRSVSNSRRTTAIPSRTPQTFAQSCRTFTSS